MIIFQYKIHLDCLCSLLLSSHIYDEGFLGHDVSQTTNMESVWVLTTHGLTCTWSPTHKITLSVVLNAWCKSKGSHYFNQTPQQNSSLLIQMNLLLSNLQSINVTFSVFGFLGKMFILHWKFRFPLSGFAFRHSSSCIYVSDGIVCPFTWRGEGDKIDEDTCKIASQLRNKPSDCLGLEHPTQ